MVAGKEADAPYFNLLLTQLGELRNWYKPSKFNKLA
jgi:hypothetical protein